jgi:hypothetical protein
MDACSEKHTKPIYTLSGHSAELLAYFLILKK